MGLEATAIKMQCPTNGNDNPMKLNPLRNQIMTALLISTGTVDRIARRLHANQDSVRNRLRELHIAGLVCVVSKEHRSTRPFNVWGIA